MVVSWSGVSEVQDRCAQQEHIIAGRIIETTWLTWLVMDDLLGFRMQDVYCSNAQQDGMLWLVNLPARLVQ